MKHPDGDIIIRCLKPPLVMPDEGVVMSKVGDTTRIKELTHYWQGMVARKAIEVVSDEPAETEPETKKVEVEKPKPKPKPKNKKR